MLACSSLDNKNPIVYTVVMFVTNLPITKKVLKGAGRFTAVAEGAAY